ncbi:Spx/MgsR family RNA polymerase-binding regulatory protein [Spiroplasma platyhelix]|uniref:Transcriptional regulator Spx n=1 Tax=Spiroplasma platyhelix PALS-1 TaxID=1276218 RepID=A0A846TZD4_9MOLU|nr:Spx/MgsR family RNA polymerase-binding regulatory protein [Spiroplasma platyhelix]MBE4703771.1 Regulatory protein Spx [Spiroplasma platyhelix PALS-1]NKE38144.1 transcriptional regulator Spx [Spiroplasma platyhelix PALS-1]UJB29029.1 regulatory protein spx [Spiroplasma platyhelix PALS-1]
MIKVYVSPSCLSSKKVMQFFDKNNISYIKRNIIKEPLTESEIKVLLRFATNGINDIISSRAKLIKHHVFNIESLKLSQIYHLISTSPTVLKRPLILQENKERLQIGYNEDEIEIFLRNDSNNENNEQCEFF